MEEHDCPECGVTLYMTLGVFSSNWTDPPQPIVPVHSYGCPERLSGSPVSVGRSCPANLMLLADAQAVVDIRRVGGERLRLAAHP